jgi:hypothetical protein
MSRFRICPVEVDAERFDGTAMGGYRVMSRLGLTEDTVELQFPDIGELGCRLVLRDGDRQRTARPGDYVVRSGDRLIPVPTAVFESICELIE